MKYEPVSDIDLLDLGAGNALGSILAVHLLPVRHAVAIDNKPRERSGHANVKRFTYKRGDAFYPDWNKVVGEKREYKTVIISIHPCAQLATRVVDIYLGSPEYIGLVLMPCCNGHQNDKKIPTAFRSRISKYEAWAWWLAERVGGDLFVDKNVLSPCNAIVVARKEKT